MIWRLLNYNLFAVLDVYARVEGFGVGLGAGEGVDGAVGFIGFGISIDVADACGVLLATNQFKVA